MTPLFFVIAKEVSDQETTVAIHKLFIFSSFIVDCFVPRNDDTFVMISPLNVIARKYDEAIH